MKFIKIVFGIILLSCFVFCKQGETSAVSDKKITTSGDKTESKTKTKKILAKNYACRLKYTCNILISTFKEI